MCSMSLTVVVSARWNWVVMRPAIWSGGRPVYCHTTAITGMRMSGKMSTGVRSAESGPTIRISNASTTKVYGRRSAMRTIPTIQRLLPGGGALYVANHVLRRAPAECDRPQHKLGVKFVALRRFADLGGRAGGSVAIPARRRGLTRINDFDESRPRHKRVPSRPRPRLPAPASIGRGLLRSRVAQYPNETADRRMWTRRSTPKDSYGGASAHIACHRFE